MKRVVLAALVVVLVAMTDADAASLAPPGVRSQVLAATLALSERVDAAQGTGGAEFSGLGLLGICAKKRGRPYSCRVDLVVTYVRQGPQGWVFSHAPCSAWVLATRRSWRFSVLGFTCPVEWNPSYQ